MTGKGKGQRSMRQTYKHLGQKRYHDFAHIKKNYLSNSIGIVPLISMRSFGFQIIN